ncbi:MAG: polysaccharide biosynthesis protein [Planctomycetota bacterium]
MPNIPAAVAPVEPTIEEQLLGREPVRLDEPAVQRFLAGRRVMVTGAGGSIGSELCRQIMRFCPETLIAVERFENALFEIDRELREKWVGESVEPVIADVTDKHRINDVFADHRPQVVLHAAAHKHVPMMERHPGEAVKNNVFGTQNVAEASAEFGVEALVFISTDKAVRPTSVMGATKRVGEMIVCAGDGPRTSVVRFGNVLGSNGSVVPIFQRQIDAGGPVTVTHPDMRRFFMTIPEAAQLVLQAGTIGQGGEIFVLEMGEPVRILDLAEAMIRRAGLVPGSDIRIKFSGIRPGEKLEEELAEDDEPALPTRCEKIRVLRSNGVEPASVEKHLATLRQVTNAPASEVVAALRSAVATYQHRQDTPMRLAA